MREERIEIRLQRGRIEELTADERRGMDVALAAAERAYAPYSRFHVGAAVELADGRLVPGSNQENAAYPSGLCAERTAMFAAQAQCPSQSVVALAIAAKNNGVPTARPVAPCGACRQSLIEIEERYKRPMKVLLCGTEGVYIVNSVKDLLPLSFIGDSMIETL